jgi:hypothetical protein
MREEAPREQQDRRAYISKEYMAGWAGFYRHSGADLARTEARHGGKQVFETPSSERQPLRHLRIS